RLVANVACAGCHTDGSGYKSPVSGKMLKTPHGGTFGYPVTDGRWLWGGISQKEWQSKELPGATSQYSLKEQFHLIRGGGRQMGRANCRDGNKAGLEGAAGTQGVRESGGGCPGATEAAAAAQTATARGGFAERAMGPMAAARPNAPQCVSCH